MEQQLKQRLVGAVVLVSLAVIFIPIILEGPGDEWSPRSQSIPRPPPLDFRSGMELPLPEASDASAPVPAVVASMPAEIPPVQAERDGSRPATAVPEPAAPSAAPLPAEPATPPAIPEAAAGAPPADGWYAQVGSFAQPANATALRERLAKAGYTATVQRADTGKGSSYRVLVGPERVRGSAEQLLEKLGREQKLEGIVIELSAGSG
ncbi:MAG: SPOR domain-containing protein [Gammaproteobacteria bacterium]|jgi:DedD protein